MRRNENFYHINGVPYFERIRKNEAAQNKDSKTKDPAQIAFESIQNTKLHTLIM